MRRVHMGVGFKTWERNTPSARISQFPFSCLIGPSGSGLCLESQPLLLYQVLM